MNRTFEIRSISNACQGGEVLPQGFQPLTSRYFDTKAGRFACKRELSRKLSEMGVNWDEVRPVETTTEDIEGWEERHVDGRSSKGEVR